MSFTTQSKYLDSARLRNFAVQSQLQVKLDRLRHDSDAVQARITKRQAALRGRLHESRIANGLQQQSPSQYLLAQSILQSNAMRCRLSRDFEPPSSKRRAKSATPSISLDQFDRRMRQWKRERTAHDRQSCCIHVDPRYGTPCFVPNVETAYLSGGFHMSLYP